MEKTLVLKSQLRENAGSKHAARIRAQGQIPAVIYGHKQKPVTVSLDGHDFVERLHHGHRLFDIKLNKKTEKVIVKALQYDYLGKNIIHADLIRVDVTERVKFSVPIEFKGTAQGTHEGGIIEEHLNKLEIECIVTEIPESILVSIKDVNVGDTLHASDIELPEGVKLITKPSTVIATCSLVAAAKSIEEVEEEQAEETAEPEIIGKEKEQDEEKEQK